MWCGFAQGGLETQAAAPPTNGRRYGGRRMHTGAPPTVIRLAGDGGRHLPPDGGGESDPPVSCLAGDRQLTAPFRQGGQTGMLGGKIFRLRCAALRMTEPGGFMRICRGGPPPSSALRGTADDTSPDGGGKSVVRICTGRTRNADRRAADQWSAIREPRNTDRGGSWRSDQGRR